MDGATEALKITALVYEELEKMIGCFQHTANYDSRPEASGLIPGFSLC
jgi:hypothetical protein